jgi:hypothetical protein
MKKGNISIGIAIAIAMTAVLMVSGCVNEVGDIAEDIGDIGEKEYTVTLIKGVKRDIDVNSEYALLIKRVHGKQGMIKEAEVLIEIFSNNISIGQRTLIQGSDEEVAVERLTLKLVRVDRSEEYASIQIKEKVDIVGYGKETAEAVGNIAKSVAESQT